MHLPPSLNDNPHKGPLVPTSFPTQEKGVAARPQSGFSVPEHRPFAAPSFLRRQLDFAEAMMHALRHPLQASAARGASQRKQMTYIRYIFSNWFAPEAPLPEQPTNQELYAATLLAVRKAHANTGWVKTFATYFAVNLKLWLLYVFLFGLFLMVYLGDARCFDRAAEATNPMTWVRYFEFQKQRAEFIREHPQYDPKNAHQYRLDHPSQTQSSPSQ